MVQNFGDCYWACYFRALDCDALKKGATQSDITNVCTEACSPGVFETFEQAKEVGKEVMDHWCEKPLPRPEPIKVPVSITMRANKFSPTFSLVAVGLIVFGALLIKDRGRKSFEVAGLFYRLIGRLAS